MTYLALHTSAAPGSVHGIAAGTPV